MTSEQIAELRALDTAAKQPPWVVEGAYVFPGDPDEVEGEAVWIFGTEDCGHPPTAALIVAMRNALSCLLDEREALLGALRGLDTDCEPTGAIGSHRDTEGNGGWAPEECPLCRARAALAKAESP